MRLPTPIFHLRLPIAFSALAFLAVAPASGQDQHRRATIHRASGPVVIDGRLDDQAWEKAQPIGDFVFTWWKEGDGKRQQTAARMLWDDDHLYVFFHCIDEDVLATRTERDSDVYRDDCVEVFASPEYEHPENYFNLEMNALGTQLDNYRPGGKSLDQAWNPDGIKIAVEIDGTVNDSSDVDRGWNLEVAIPIRLFAEVMPQGHPVVGTKWRLNLNRLEGNMSVKSQWSRGEVAIPRFHTPQWFGHVEFDD